MINLKQRIHCTLETRKLQRAYTRARGSKTRTGAAAPPAATLTASPPDPHAVSPARRIFSCLMIVVLCAGLAIPLGSVFDKADAVQSTACDLTWEQLKPHLEDGLGVPYVFGGGNPSGWDCSGYVSYTFNTFAGTDYTHYTRSFAAELEAQGCFSFEGDGGNLTDSRFEPGDIIFFYSDMGGGSAEITHMGVVGERVDGHVMIYHAFTNSFSDIYGNSGTMLQGLDGNPGSSLAGIWYMSSGHGKGNWAKFSVFHGVKNNGWAAVQKVSANPSATDGNDRYSLAGATFGVYSDPGCTNRVCTMATNESGTAQSSELTPGTYYIREIDPPRGYYLNTTVYEVNVPAGDVSTVTIPDEPIMGFVELTKTSANPNISDDNACYSVAQATYTIYSDSECQNAVTSFTTDESGYAKSALIPLGYYWVRETTAPDSYALNDTVAAVDVVDDNGVMLTQEQTEELPKCNPISLVMSKVDAELSEQFGVENVKGLTLGSATLTGAEFTVRYYDGYYDSVEALPEQAKRTWILKTDEQGEAYLDDEHLVSGDPFYTDSQGAISLPLGTVVVEETKAPNGYLIGADGTPTTFIQQITPWGESESEIATGETLHQYNATIQPDNVKRGDLALVKVDDETDKRLRGVAFKVTSDTTGESHVMVTGDNGYLRTESSWNAHSANTNGNDTIEDETYDVDAGSWFSGRTDLAPEADDRRGALPYDTYTLEELRCEANKGLQLSTIDHIVVSRDATTIELGSLDDSSVNIGTIARDQEDGDHAIRAIDTACIVDRVSYLGLIPGRLYTVDGTLMSKETGEPLLIDDQPVTANVNFTPEQSSGFIELAFPLDASHLQKQELVVFETLSLTGDVLATHEDLDDVEQTIEVLGPAIGTSAADGADGDKKVSAGPEATIVDTVSYQNLLAGTEYQLLGELMDTETGEPFLVNDATITAETTFTPEEPNGTVEVTFTFDASTAAGKKLVVFETLMSNDREVVYHRDLNDENQTVTVEAPSIGTSAKDGTDGDKTVQIESKSTIVDTVHYEGLIPGATYDLSGTLMSKETGTPIESDGKPVTGSARFVAEASSGSVDVMFNFDSRVLSDGQSAVVFEQLTLDGELVAAHEDIDDAKQTVTMYSIADDAAGKGKTGYAKTGRDTFYALIGGTIGLLIASGASAVAGLRRRW